MAEIGTETAEYIKFMGEDSGNVAEDGNFSIQVMAEALKAFDLVPVSLQSTEGAEARRAPLMQRAFICNHGAHWFTIRKVGGYWWNFNSLNKSGSPEYVSDFYLSLLLDSLKAEDISIFAIIGEVRDNPGDLGGSAGGLGGKWVTVYPRGGGGGGGGGGGAGGGWHDNDDDQVQNAIALSLAQDEEDAMAAAIAASLRDNDTTAAPAAKPQPPAVAASPENPPSKGDDDEEAKALAMSRALSAPEGEYTLHVQLGNDTLQRSFSGECTLNVVYDWIFGATGKKQGVLVSSFPKKEFPKSATITLNDAGFDGKRIKLIYQL